MIQKVVKRDNETLVDYNSNKIRDAIRKANLRVDKNDRIEKEDIDQIIHTIEHSDQWKVRDIKEGISSIEQVSSILVEEIQDIVECELMKLGKYQLAKEYITYRFKRAMVRRSNTTDDSILSLLKDNNDEVSKENSNKKARVK